MAVSDDYIFPGRHGATGGAHIPPWLLSLGLPAEQTVLWSVIARCASGRKSTRGFSIPRLAAVLGWSTGRVRSTVHQLEAAGLIERELQPGMRPIFKFPRHPRCMTQDGKHLTWNGLLLAAESDLESNA